jgi:hypothetical protein
VGRGPGQTFPRGARLGDRVIAALKQAMIDDRPDVTEHLPRTLDALAPDCASGSPLAEACLLVAQREER